MHPLRGILFKIASVSLFVVMASCIKAASTHVPPGEAVFFRSFFALPVIFIWLWHRRELSVGFSMKDPMAHLWRGLMGTTAMGFTFAGLEFLPLPEVTAVNYATPLLLVIFASMFLGEDVRLFRLGAVALGLIGVLIVLSPRLTSISAGEIENRDALGAMFVLTGAVFAALTQVFIRKIVATERTSAIVFWFSITATLMSLLTLPFGWVMPTGNEVMLLVSAGVIGGVAQIFLTSSYRFAAASVVAPFEYTSMLLALTIGYFVFSEVPTRSMLAGAGLVILAGILVILRERKLGLERARQKQASSLIG